MLTGKETLSEAVMALSKGNPGALRVTLECINNTAGGFESLLHMDDMGLCGPAIWIGYKDYCGERILDFIYALKNRDPEMVRVIKENGYDAVTSGASFK